MKKKLILMLICAWLLTNAWAQKVPTIQEVKDKYRKSILETMKKENVVGVSIVVLNSDSILWKESFGYADKSMNKLVDEHTQFGIGSVTKVFTATAALQAQEQSLWNIDKPLSDYLPFNPKTGKKEAVTLRLMLSHHSGLPSDILSGMVTEKVGTTSVLEAINQEPLAHQPGLIQAYSNPAFELIGEGIAKVSGVSYPEFIQRNIFKPLGMNTSHFDCTSNEVSKTYNREGLEAKDGCTRGLSAGGLFTTASEMTLWAKAMLQEDERILSKKSYQDMFSVQNENVALDFNNLSGLAWSQREKPYLGKYWSHTGTTLYYNASLIVAKEADLSIIILTNSENGGRVYRLGSIILDEIAKAQGLSIAKSSNSNLGNAKKIEVENSVLDAYVGTYVQPGMTMNVRRDGNKLKTAVAGYNVTLIPVAEHTFIPKLWLFKIIPIRLKDLRWQFENIGGYSLITQIEVNRPKEILGARFEQQSTLDWKNLAGKYVKADSVAGELYLMKSIELQTSKEGPVLAMKIHGSSQEAMMLLNVKSNTQATIAGLGRYAGTEVEVIKLDEQETIIKAFGVKLRRVQ